ncbi:hypothetical protein SK128_005867, partial [Halocaridina rubra]
MTTQDNSSDVLQVLKFLQESEQRQLYQDEFRRKLTTFDARRKMHDLWHSYRRCHRCGVAQLPCPQLLYKHKL